jgi:hypothetical protein
MINDTLTDTMGEKWRIKNSSIETNGKYMYIKQREGTHFKRIQEDVQRLPSSLEDSKLWLGDVYNSCYMNTLKISDKTITPRTKKIQYDLETNFGNGRTFLTIKTEIEKN